MPGAIPEKMLQMLIPVAEALGEDQRADSLANEHSPTF
jgi:hypothetical protein